jgi:uncharacterized protein
MKFVDRIKLFVNGYHDLFSQGECYEFGKHVEQNFEQALVLYQQAMDEGDPRAYFRMAQWYQTEKKLPQALRAYYEGAIRGHEQSKQSLKALAEDGDADAALFRGHVEVAGSHWEAAMGWYRTAVCLGSKYALGELLKHSVSNQNACFQLAQMYEFDMYESGKNKDEDEGEDKDEDKEEDNGGSSPQMVKAVQFYEQASQLGESRASFRLGQLFEPGEEKKDIKPERLKSYRYYARAARQHHPQAQSHLEPLASAGDVDAQYALGFHYYHEEGDISQAADWCVKAHRQGHLQALAYLMQTKFDAPLCLRIARQYDADDIYLPQALKFYQSASQLGEPQASFRLGQWYETGNEDCKPDFTKSCDFYLLAMKQKHPQAKAQLEHLAATGHAEAQYTMGYHICHKEGDVAQAARWCVKADMQGHQQATNYLTHTRFNARVCLQIARQYEVSKTDPAESLLKALAFYSRVARKGDPAAALWLAQFHEVDHPGMKRDPQQAFDYYLQAAQRDAPDAWAPLERLGEQMDAQRQKALSELYSTIFDDERQAYWRQQAGEVQRMRLTR